MPICKETLTKYNRLMYASGLAPQERHEIIVSLAGDMAPNASAQELRRIIEDVEGLPHSA